VKWAEEFEGSVPSLSDVSATRDTPIIVENCSNDGACIIDPIPMWEVKRQTHDEDAIQ
jgi:hypothetical protein